MADTPELELTEDDAAQMLEGLGFSGASSMSAKQKGEAVMAALALASDYTSRLEYANQERRRTHGGRLDMLKVLGYPERIGFRDYWARYTRQDVAGRAIDLPVDTTWGGGKLQVEGWPEWAAFDDRLSATSRLAEADRLAGLGEYAVLLVGLRTDQPVKGRAEIAEFLKQPAEKISSLDDVLFLRQYHRDAARISKSDDDMGSARFGLPSVYKIDIGTNYTNDSGAATEPRTQDTYEVHWSRVIHITSSVQTNEIVGLPRLMRAFDRLLDLEKIVGGGAEMWWQGADRSWHINAAGRQGITAGQEQAFNAKLEKFMMGLRRVLITSNAEVKTMPSVQPDPSGFAETILTLISAAVGIPKRILVGSEQGELASTQDRANFFDTIANRRSNYAEPHVLKPLIDRLNYLGAAPDFGTLTWVWPAIEALGPMERAEVAERKARAAKTMEEAAALGLVSTNEELRGDLGRLENPGDDITGNDSGLLDEADPDTQNAFQSRK